MCLSCSNEHKNHKIILYQDKLIDIEKLRNKMHKYENEINKFKQNLEDMISKLKKIIENINIIYNINNNLLNNYKNKKRNYRLLLNLHYMNEYLENEINYIKDKYNYGYNINKLLNIEDNKLKKNKISNLNNQNKKKCKC